MEHTCEKILPLTELQPVVTRWKEQGEKVVFTNGCFDILHLGHVDYLEKASRFGTKLILGLNSDESVRRLKGKDRPVNEEHARSRILAALSFVDAVTIFQEDTPLELIESLTPDILVKGSDYSISSIVGAEHVMGHGGKVCTVELVEGFSTTGIIEKISK